MTLKERLSGVPFPPLRRQNLNLSGNLPLREVKKIHEEEQGIIFNKTASSAILAVGSSYAACLHPLFAIPAVVFYARLVHNFRRLDNLEEEASSEL